MSEVVSQMKDRTKQARDLLDECKQEQQEMLTNAENDEEHEYNLAIVADRQEQLREIEQALDNADQINADLTSLLKDNEDDTSKIENIADSAFNRVELLSLKPSRHWCVLY